MQDYLDKLEHMEREIDSFQANNRSFWEGRE